MWAALIGLGTIEAAKGEPQSALERFEMAIEIEPHEAEAHFRRARVLDSMGKTDEALGAYFRTLEFNPLHPEVSQRIGAIQASRNQADQALVRLDQAVDLAPDDGEVHLLRGRAHFLLRHVPQAIVDFRAGRPPTFGAGRCPLSACPSTRGRPHEDRGHQGRRDRPPSRARLRRRPRPFRTASTVSGRMPGLPALSQPSSFSATTSFRRVPSSSISTSTTSPGLSQTGGLRAIPTPGGVPVKIRSPASSVMICDR